MFKNKKLNQHKHQLLTYCSILDTEDASETDMAKLEEEFTEMKEQWVRWVLWNVDLSIRSWSSCKENE